MHGIRSIVVDQEDVLVVAVLVNKKVIMAGKAHIIDGLKVVKYTMKGQPFMSTSMPTRFVTSSRVAS
jgi:hypothetical protein